ARWRRATATFAVPSMAAQDAAVTFILSAPDIAVDGAEVDIRNITLRFHRDPLTFRRAAAGMWHALTPW
ncbi:hypothetical protein HYS28_00890, partial [Candidatus Uhrbacteria bacterium]|nr:hypothetical protein [Candidatus Uhrbacteria bacterium]